MAEPVDMQSLPPALPGFGHIKRYWDKGNSVHAAKILPGEYYVTCAGEMVTTVLGSCVSACIRDPASGIGGMNHFMLPATESIDSSAWTGDNAATRYGNFAMEHLINEILKKGAKREVLEVKVFGGGQVLKMGSSVAQQNVDFVREYLRTEGIRIVAEDVGGTDPRKVNYYPATGKVRVKRLTDEAVDNIRRSEETYISSLDQKPADDDIELF